VIINGPIGDHGIAVLAQRQGLRFKVPVESDCAPLNSLVEDILKYPRDIHSLRDPTRGGLATILNEVAGQSGVNIKLFEEKIPVRESVGSACAMLGLDPLYVANEGKIVVIVAPEHAGDILTLMKKNPYGSQSSVIGEILDGHPGRVTLKTRLGTSRIIDMLSGELLPRIC
jgi:hydrogenase expression/formation protein HypE